MNKYCILMLVSAVLNGCASLEQAPLVYSSKQIIGFDVSLGAPDSNISIGYTSLDAAYVPVAVSKEGLGKIEKIEGTATDGNSTMSITDEMERLKRDANQEYNNASSKVDDTSSEIEKLATTNKNLKSGNDGKNMILSSLDAELNKTKLNIKDRISVIEKKEKEKINLEEQITKFSAENSQISADIQEPTLIDDNVVLNDESKSGLKSRLDSIENDMTKLRTDQDEDIAREKNISNKLNDETVEVKNYIEGNDESINENNKKIAQLRSRLAEEVAKMEEKKAAAAKVANEQNHNTEEKKSDAYSVYGKFDSGSTYFWQNELNSSVDIGKVFSTGVASQHISQGIKTKAVNDAVGNCLKNLANAMGEGNVTESAATICKITINGNGI